jgi:hypothetical protein
MKKHLIKLCVASLALVYSAQQVYAAEAPDFSTTFILKNNSAFDVKYKYAQPSKNVAANEEMVLNPQDSVQINDRGYVTISIRRSGWGSTLLTSWAQVPSIDDLIQKLSRNDAQTYYNKINQRGCTPVINIQSGYTGGWDFKLTYTCSR